MKNQDRLAYPCHSEMTSPFTVEGGLTKLERYTLAAMQALLSKVGPERGFDFDNPTQTLSSQNKELLADLAIDYAEATLQALERRKESE